MTQAVIILVRTDPSCAETKYLMHAVFVGVYVCACEYVCEYVCHTHVGNGVEEGEVGSPHAGVTDAVEEAAHGGEHEGGGEGGQQATHCQCQEGFRVRQQ